MTLMLFPLTMASGQTNTGRPAQPQSTKGVQVLLADAPIDRQVMERIRSKLESNSDGTDSEIAGRSRVDFVELGSGGKHPAIEIEAPHEWCGATGNCPIWIFDRKTGALLFSDDGFSLGFRQTVHHGARDIYIRANRNYRTGVRHEYEFDGTVYKLVRELDEQY
jgi:hypothetical protein